MARKGATTQSQAERDRRLSEIAPLLLSDMTQWDIAERLGVDQSTISRDVRTLRQRWQKAAQEDMQRYIGEMVAIYKLLIGAHLPLAIAGKARSAEVVMSALEKMAVLMGLNQPTKQQIDLGEFPALRILRMGDEG